MDVPMILGSRWLGNVRWSHCDMAAHTTYPKGLPPSFTLLKNKQGGTQKMEFIYKKLCTYMFKLQSPSKYSHLMHYTCETFFPLLKTVLNLLILISFSVSAFFVCLFHIFHVGKTFPFEDFFHPGNKNVVWGEIRWIRRVRHRGHAVFGQKLLSTQRGVGRCTCKSPTMQWANVLKESSKKSTEAEHSLSQQH